MEMQRVDLCTPAPRAGYPARKRRRGGSRRLMRQRCVMCRALRGGEVCR